MQQEISTTIAIAGALFSGLAVFFLWLQIKKAHEWNRRKATLDFLIKLTEGELKTIHVELETKYDFRMSDRKQTYPDVVSGLKTKEDKERVKSLTKVMLNHYETACIGMKHHVYDEDIVYENISFIMISAFQWAQEVVDEYRSKDPTIYIETLFYVEKWRKREETEINKLRSSGKDKT